MIAFIRINCQEGWILAYDCLCFFRSRIPAGRHGPGALPPADPAARAVYAEAADLLGLDLLQLDEEQLAQTRFAQLSIVTLSLAAWAAFRGPAAKLDRPLVFAGFSLGEYSALGAAGVLGLTDLLRLVNERARLMQEAADASPGAMFAVLGLDDEQAAGNRRPAGQYAGKVFAVNFNCPGQMVIAGCTDAAACAEELKAAGARRLVQLNVSGAFHTPLMAAAARQLAEFARG